MANLASVLKDEIKRLAKREVTAATGAKNKQISQQRRDIAELKRQMTEMKRRMKFLEGQEKKRVSAGPSSDGAQNTRFSAKWLAKHREKLDLSAADYGALVGVTGQTIYSWEQGKSKPRDSQLAGIADVRGLGKREAQHRLELL